MNTKQKQMKIQTIAMLLALTAACCILIFHSYLLGNDTVAFYDVGTDSKDQYMMWYNGIVNSLRNGSFSTWDFRNGFGMNTMQHNLTEPFLIPIFFLGYLFGPEHLTHYMAWMEVIRILIAAFVCYWYLSEFSFSEPSKLIASLLYSMNAFMMVWGQHYAIGSALVYLPLILLGVEKVFRKKGFGFGLCFSSCLTLLSSFYLGYMCMLFGGIYVVFRVIMLEKHSFAERVKCFFLSAASMILGVLLSAVRFFPSAAAQVGSSARLASDASLMERVVIPRIWDAGMIKTIIYRMFSSCIQGNGNEIYIGQPRFSVMKEGQELFGGQMNFYEAPALFFSTLFIILLLQYVVLLPMMKDSIKNKLMQYVIVAGSAAGVLLMNLTTVFNGFYKPFFRHTFVLMPVFALMCAKVLDHIYTRKKVSKIALLVAATAISGVYMKAYRILPEAQFKNNAMLLLLTGLVLIGLIYGLAKSRNDVWIALAIVAAANITTDGYLCYHHRVLLTKDHPEYYAETYHSDVDEALDWIEANDPEFYRVEKDYFTAASCFDSLAQDYRAMSAYNANQNANIKEFTAKLWPQLNHERDIYHMQFQNALWDTTLAGLCDVRYILSKSEAMPIRGYRKVNQIGDISIYQNEEAQSLGTFYGNTMTEAQFEEASGSLNTRELLKQVLITEDDTPYALAGKEIKNYEKQLIPKAVLGNLESFYEPHGPFELELNLNEQELASWENVILQFTIGAEKRTVVNVTINDRYTHSFVQNWKESRDIHLELPEEARKVYISIENPSGWIRLSDFTFYGSRQSTTFNAGAEIFINAPEKDSHLTGTMSLPENGYVMLTIPYETGWKVAVDDKNQELIRGDYGFIAFAAEAGEHDLEVTFTPPLLKEGAAVSTGSILVVLLILIIGKRKQGIA